MAIERTQVSVCEKGAWSTDKDPNGLNIRAAPGTDSRIVGKIPPPIGLDGDPIASEVSITGSRDGWFRIERAFFVDYHRDEKSEVFFQGEGWVSGRYLALDLEWNELFGEPSTSAPVVARFTAQLDGRGGAAYFAVERLHACLGNWVEVEGTYFGKRLRGWSYATCANQVTTCGGGHVPDPE